jgi:hypothetical protein
VAEDESGRGWALVQGCEDWRLEVARWIAAAQEAQREADEHEGDLLPAMEPEEVSVEGTTSSQSAPSCRLAHL